MKGLLVFLAIALLSSESAFAANPQLLKSTPPDGSSGTPPAAFVLEVSKPMHLHQLYFRKDNGDWQSIEHLSTKVQTTISVPAPSLAPGKYDLEWIAFGDNAFALRGTIHFTVSAAPVGAPSTPR